MAICRRLKNGAVYALQQFIEGTPIHELNTNAARAVIKTNSSPANAGYADAADDSAYIEAIISGDAVVGPLSSINV